MSLDPFKMGLTSLLESVRKWDDAQPGNVSEWPPPEVRRAFSVIIPDEPVVHWVITTKAVWIDSVFEPDGQLPEGVGIVVASVLPTDGQIATLNRSLLQNARAAFVGDLDPYDLCIFLKIKASAPQLDLTWSGVGDRWFKAIGIGVATEKTAPIQFPMTPLERKVLRSMKSAGIIVGEIVGESANLVLQAGKKIELEGASNRQILGDGVAGARELFGGNHQE